MTVAAVVLAAGAGSRLGRATPKPLAPFRGRPLVHHALDAARSSGLHPVVVVVGRDAEAVAAAVPAGVRVVHNHAWTSGIASSLAAALAALAGDPEVDAAVIGLADQPLVRAEAYRRLADAHGHGADLAVATYAGRRANPVLVGRGLWSEAMALTGDAGARQLMTDHPVVEVACDGCGDPADVDTEADLAALEAGPAMPEW